MKILWETVSTAKKRLLKMHFKSGVGHIGGNLSALDAMLVVFHEYLGTHSKFVLSKGHAAGASYTTLWSVDPDFALTGLAERQAFAIYAGGVRAPDGVHRRLAQLNYGFKKSKLAEEALQFANQNSIAWYLRRPEDVIVWPDDLDSFAQYRCEDCRDYHFQSSLNTSISQLRVATK